jgi:hypothetical protein
MPRWDIVVSIVWFVIVFRWIWWLITIFAGIVRVHEMSGWGKAIWTLFLSGASERMPA